MTSLLLLAVFAQPLPYPPTGPLAMAPLPPRAPSPLLYVRFAGPEGTRATFYQGKAPPRKFDAPVSVGMRPGYLYRMRLEQKGVVVYPTFEIHGSLQLHPKLSTAEYPVPVNLSEADFEAIANGGMVTKVYYLEHPDKAEPRATKPGEVIEIEVPRSGNILHEARTRGRVMAVLHLGQREPPADELATINVPGTILFPGAKAVAQAAAPPLLPMAVWPFFDPRVGPRKPEEECLHDGGDRGLKAGFDPQGKLVNIDPEDTVAEWTDSRGRRHVVPSNRVCICVPRYLALRKFLPIAAADGQLGPIASVASKREGVFNGTQPVDLVRRAKGPMGLDGRLRPAEDKNVTAIGVFRQLKVLKAEQLNLGVVELIGTKGIETLRKDERLVLLQASKLVADLAGVTGIAQMDNSVGTSVIARVKNGPQVVEGFVSLRDLTACCDLPVPLPPDKPLHLVKCADKVAAKVGDLVTFSLKYTNVGGRPLTDVAVVDSLSGRLEYVEGSSKSDREAVFTARDNEAGSQLLRWEISGTLQPGESGRIQFQVRVR
jgi:uncharacterized repeat protein (TIGR01451 family)